MLRLDKGDVSELSWNPLLVREVTSTFRQYLLGTWENVALLGDFKATSVPIPNFLRKWAETGLKRFLLLSIHF